MTMTNDQPEERFYKVSPGDKVKSRYGVTDGLIGVVIKVYSKPVPSIDVGFSAKNSRLREFMTSKKHPDLVIFRLAAGEFTPIDKTKYSIPKSN